MRATKSSTPDVGAADSRCEPVGTLLRSDDIVSLTELRRSALYADVLRPPQTEHSAMASLFSRADFAGALCFTRSPAQGPFGERDMTLLRRLLPHMQRSINLSERVEGYRLLQCGNLAPFGCCAWRRQRYVGSLPPGRHAGVAVHL